MKKALSLSCFCRSLSQIGAGLLALLLLTTGAALHAAPLNDNFASSIALRSLVMTTTGDNTGASREGGEPFHWATTGGNSVWWNWIAPFSGAATITTSNSSFDTILAVYTGSAVSSLTLVGNNDDNDPGVIKWSSVAFNAVAGTTYQIAADGYGGAVGSIVLNVTGPAPGAPISLVPAGAPWKYLDTGSDQGTGWIQPAFDDATWLDGVAQLGFGEFDEATVIQQTNSLDGSTNITFYFRKAFTVANPAAFASLNLSLLRDDGGVVYLNGQEVFRTPNMPAGANYLTLATATGENTVDTASLPASALVSGNNVVAVEVHQQALTSSDVSFDFSLSGVPVVSGSNGAPVVAITSPAGGASVASGAFVPVSVDAHDQDGSVARVELYLDGGKITETTTHPYAMTWIPAALGAHSLTAVVVDNLGLAVTSAPVAVQVTAGVLAGALEFNGANNYVTFGYAPALGVSNFTLEVWFKRTGTGVAGSSGGGGILAIPLLTKGRGESDGNNLDCNFFLGIDTARGVLAADFESFEYFATNNHPVYGNTVITNNGWYHAAATFNGTNWSLYLNGVLETNAPAPYTPRWDNLQHAALATSLDSGGNPAGYFAGVLDEARIWNYARSGAQIAAGKNQEITSGTGLLARWGMNQAGGALLANSVAGGVDGTLVNSPLWVPGYLFAQPPAVSITSPLDLAAFTQPAGITLDASATDPNGAVAKVEFFRNGVKLGEDTAAPFSFVWSGAGVGNHVLTAVATDDTALSSTSAPVRVTVNSPFVALTGPTNTARFAAPASIALAASTTNTATQVQFYNGASLLGTDTAAPYTFAWNSVAAGNYSLTAVATAGIRYTSAPVVISIIVNQSPTVALTSPANNATFEELAIIPLTATASDSDGAIAKVEFFTGATKLGEDSVTPFNYTWPNVTAGLAQLTAVATDDLGSRSTSAVVNVTIVTNTPPSVATVTPAPGPVGGLTVITVNFSEAVTGVDAADLLVNGVAANSVSGAGVSYTFSVIQPATNDVAITWVAGHAIADLGTPSKPFNPAAPGNTWSYVITDVTAPTILAQTPAAGSTVSSLTQVQVTFSEPVSGVGADDFLINGSPAFSASGSGANYTFTFPQPAPGQVDIRWAVGHGIADLAAAPNAFEAAGAGATWSYTVLTPRTPLVVANSVWKFLDDGTDQGTAWSQTAFDDSAWTNGPAELGFGDLDEATVVNGGPPNSRFITTYFRRAFAVTNAASFTNLIVRLRRDDGAVIYLNGVEIFRSNIAGDPILFNTLASSAAGDDGYTWFEGNASVSSLVEGSNLVAVEIHQSAPSSSDISFDLELIGEGGGTAYSPPYLTVVSPTPGDVLALTNITVTFSEPVTGVNASDLLINGTSASTVSGGTSNTTFTFGFSQPAFGAVSVTWTAGHGILDFDTPPHEFNATAPGATFQYRLFNPNAPTVLSQNPVGGSTVLNTLTQIQVTFSKAVSGVDAADLFINATPASGVSGSGANYTFTFAQPAYGNVAITWAALPGITESGVPANAFEPARPGATWQYTFIDTIAPTVVGQTPAAGGNVTNLTQITVQFSEAVQNVDAADLLINGVAATGATGTNATYTFTFPQPNATVLNISWAANHGITDFAAVPNAFDASVPSANWIYLTPDNVAPTVVSLTPAAGATVRALAQITVVFNEIVTGINAADLLVKGAPATGMSGSGAGPYTFTFTPPATGAVAVAWAAAHGIRDFAAPANNFAGGSWNYTLNPNAKFDGAVVINEIMYHPISENPLEEYIELRNVTASPINLAGWRFTRGIDFAFPVATIPAFGFVVVAADLATFQAKYPGVTNVLGNWVGRLSNIDEDVEIEDATGTRVDLVHYASQGDWAIRQRGINDLGSYGWEWYAEHDGTVMNTGPGGEIGGGKSLELIQALQLNDNGQNWSASGPVGGTPGRTNSITATNIAPLIYSVAHFPAVPKPTNVVFITAQLVDEKTNGITAQLFFRDATSTAPGAFVSTNFLDDGLHGDGAAKDGIFGAILLASANGTIIEFYVQAADSFGVSRTWPAAARQLDGSFAQTANALYQVDDNLAPPSPSTASHPLYRVIMTGAERLELQNINSSSDAEMNATFVTVDGSETEIRCNCGIRIRGAGSRGRAVKNHRINIPNDRRWKGVDEANINSQFIHLQSLGGALSAVSALPAAEARPVQLRLNGANLAGSDSFGSYVYVESLNGDWANRIMPTNSGGNVYRASIYPWIANLKFLNTTNPATWVANGYSKTSNGSENDWHDLNDLTRALSSGLPENEYLEAVRTNVNVELFLRYFALCNLLDYQETSLCRGVGDDYAMYRGTTDQRFQIVPHDFDTILGLGDSSGSTARSIWEAVVNPPSADPNLQAVFLIRFMRHPEYAPVYFRELKRLVETTFSATQFNPLADEVLGGWVPQATIDGMKTFVSGRRASVLSQLPLVYSVNVPLSMASGYFATTAASVTLDGQANAIDTKTVKVNGSTANFVVWQGRWTAAIALAPGLNNVLVQYLGAGGAEVGRTNVTIWYDDGSVQNVSGAIAVNTSWTAAGGPYNVTANLTVNSGATLTIQAGTTVYLASGVNITVANGGRIVADGAETAPIHFTRAPGNAATWGGITINGGAGSPETRFAYTHFEGNGSTAIHSSAGTVFLDHLSFSNTAVQYLSLDGSSFVVQDCVFPATTASFEPVHGTAGIKSGGRGLFLRNFFGPITGYNDVIDFTGGNRPGPILQFINNVFTGSGDDLLDLDSTDAWVEGNIFMHIHKNGSPDSSSAVSGGADNADLSQVTIIGNLFYDCDQAAMAKQGNFFTLINNTVVRQTKLGGLDTDAAVVCMADDGTVQAAGMHLEGNIIYDAEQLVRNQTTATVTFTNNLMPLTWAGPGGNNSTNNPLLKYVPQLAETTNFTSWASAQVLWDWFSLKAGSPGVGTGPNKRDKGGVVPSGAAITGEPASPTSLNSATLTVGINRTGGGIPTAGWPNGSGITHYKWRLDGGTWSAETPIATPISLAGLTPGTHYVEVSGRNDAGLYQDDPVLGIDATITRSRTWTVTPGASLVRLNELLASNDGAYNHFGTSPDIIELFNAGITTMDLAGLRLTDTPQNPSKFIFPAGATIPAGGYLAVFANNPDGKPGYHVGFSLPIEGGQVHLFDSAARGGALLDSIQFGPQLADRSVGRLADGQWALGLPTIGTANQAAPIGDPRALRINEWLTDGLPLALDDFVEIYNPQTLPVAMGGLYLTDNPVGLPAQHRIASLSFLPGYSFFAFKADGNVTSGPEHLNFRLSSEQGLIGLFDTDLTLIDSVYYNTQQPGIAMGRQPNGSTNSVFLTTPTPGSGNPAGTSGSSTNIATLTLSLLQTNAVWRYDQIHDLTDSNWTAVSYSETGWSNGPAMLAFEVNPAITNLIRTTLADPQVAAPGLTVPRLYYFRTGFNFPTNPAGFDLNLTVRLDDGAVLYLNGAELTRIRVSAGPTTYSTLAIAGPPGAGTEAITDEFFTVPAPSLVQGSNVIAVEVRQASVGSSDVVWSLGLTASKSTTNISGGMALVINEVLANNSFLRETNGSTPDWLELFNNSGAPIDLSDLSLTDDTLSPRRWVFPAGATIAPLSYLRILCEDKLPPSSNTVGVLNTGFGLKATGGGVYLYDRQAAGGSLLTSVAFGLQATDFSIGRVPDGTGPWTLAQPSPASANIAVGLGNPAALRVNEWMADPSSGDDWFEVFNPNAQPVALGGLYLTDRLNTPLKYPIPALSFLGVNTNGYQKFMADDNVGAGADHVNFKLGAAGEWLGIFTSAGMAIDSLSFGAQLTGVSEGRFPDGSATIVGFPGTDSAGEPNYRWLTNVVINEVLAHSDPPLEDAIELHNLTAAPLNLGGWWLSDSKGNLRKYRFPDSTLLPANGYVVIYESQFNADPLAPDSFALSSSDGDQVYLAEASGGSLTGWRTGVKFGASQNAVSFGRYVTSVGDEEFVAMSQRSFGKDSPATVAEFRTGAGLLNPYPLVGPIVLAEIMYHPPDLGTNDNTRDEFIKLRNITSSPVTLYDPLAATNTWRLRDAVDFDFPPGVTLPAGGALLVVGFDPVADPFTLGQFRAAYGIGTNVAIFGPYSDKLANSSDSIELKKPDPVNANGSVPYVLVEQVTYSDTAPWPNSADGLGPALQRVSATGFANDPTNWLAAAASPGGSSTADADDDGMPDLWELANSFDPSDPSDAAQDFDGDGLSNQQEYQAGTEPRNPASVMGLEITSTGPALLEFDAKDSKSYTVEYSTTLLPGSWQKLLDVPAGAERRIQVSDPAPGGRFYRLRTPQTP